MSGKECLLWLYDEGSYNYTSAKVSETTYSGYVPSLWERLRGQKHIPPQHERKLEIRAYSPHHYDTDSEGREIPDSRKGWVFAFLELAPNMDLFAKHAMESVKSHRAAHVAYIARIKSEMELRVGKADEARLATIRNLPRLPE